MFMFAAVALQASSRNNEVIVKTTAVQTKLVYAYKTVYSFDLFTLLAQYRSNS